MDFKGQSMQSQFSEIDLLMGAWLCFLAAFMISMMYSIILCIFDEFGTLQWFKRLKHKSLRLLILYDKETLEIIRQEVVEEVYKEKAEHEIEKLQVQKLQSTIDLYQKNEKKLLMGGHKAYIEHLETINKHAFRLNLKENEVDLYALAKLKHFIEKQNNND